MNHPLRPAAVLAALLFISTTCLADVITSDPNIPGASVKTAEPEKITIDSRLDQKITYKAEAKRLPEVLAELSKQTGVPMAVSSGKRFWQVRQRKVTLYLKDMPLREVMDQLEKLLDYHFSRMGEPGAYTYILWQDLSGRNNEQNTLKQQEELKRLHQRRAVDETLRDAETALMIRPEDAEKLREQNPFIAYLAGTPRGRAYAGLLLAIPRGEFDKLLADDNARIFLKLEDLPPRGQEALGKLESLIDFEKVSKEYAHNLSDQPSVDCITVQRIYGEADQDPPVPFWLHVNAEHRGVDAFAITYPDAPMDKLRSRPGGWSPEEEQARAALSNMRRGETKTEEEPDPMLEKTAEYDEIERDEGRSSLSFNMERLADLFDLDVMYEHYPIRDTGWFGYIGERTLGNALQSIVDNYHLDWTRDGATIRFRHNDWARRRSLEIPEEWIDTWRAVIEREHWLDLDTLVDITSKLTKEQVENNFRPSGFQPSVTIDDPLVVKLFNAAGISKAMYMREFLGLYGRLSAAQRKKIWSSEGLSFDEIADDPMFKGEAPTMGKTPLYDVVLSLSRGPAPEGSLEAAGEVVYMSFETTVWKRDIHAPDLERLKNQNNRGMTITDNGDMLQISQKAPFIAADREKVKALLEQIRKEQEEKQQAEKQAKE